MEGPLLTHTTPVQNPIVSECCECSRCKLNVLKNHGSHFGSNFASKFGVFSRFSGGGRGKSGPNPPGIPGSAGKRAPSPDPTASGAPSLPKELLQYAARLNTGLSRAQLRLLLGNPVIAKRVRAQDSAQEAAHVLRSAAASSRMTAIDTPPLPKPPPNSKLSASTPTRSGKGKGAPSKAPSPPTHTITIKPGMFTAPSVSSLLPGQPGVALIRDKSDLERQAQRFRHSPLAIAAVAPHPYEIPGLNKPSTVILQVDRADHASGETVDMQISGYLYQLGSVPVTVATSRADTPLQIRPRTMVIRLETHQDHAKQAHAVIKKTIGPGHPRNIAHAFREYLNGLMNEGVEPLLPPNSCIDVFAGRMESLMALARIPSSALGAYYSLAGSGHVLATPTAEAKSAHGVIWLRPPDAKNVTEARQIAQALPGYSGLVIQPAPNGSGDRFGVRVEKDLLPNARATLGREEPPSFILTGVPPDFAEQEISEVLEALSWKAAVAPQSRTMRRGFASWKIRAPNPPPKYSLVVKHGYEIATVRVESLASPAKPEPRIAAKPRTWASIVKAEPPQVAQKDLHVDGATWDPGPSVTGEEPFTVPHGAPGWDDAMEEDAECTLATQPLRKRLAQGHPAEPKRPRPTPDDEVVALREQVRTLTALVEALQAQLANS